MSDRIFASTEGQRGRITLAAGPLNILNINDITELDQALAKLSYCHIIVIEASGDRAFSAGMEVADHTRERAPIMLKALESLTERFLTTPAVTIAKVGGPALGGGFELVLLCDLSICSERARFALPEVQLAALPPIACELLPLTIGDQRARDLILTGRSIDALTAERWGVTSRLVDHEQLDHETDVLAEHLLSLSADGLACCKHAARSRNLFDALRVYTNRLLPTHDAAEGIRAFLERRTPQWQPSRSLEELTR